MDWLSMSGGVGIGLLITIPLMWRILVGKTDQAVELAATRAQLEQVSQNYHDQRIALNDATGALLDAEKRAAALEAELVQAHQQADAKLAQMIKVKEEMTGQFRILAEDVMKRHGEAFTQQNREQMDHLLLPLRHKLTDFQQELAKAHTDNAKERASLGEQIRALSETSPARLA